jgi:GT2 family glycosyltransferase
MSPSVLIVSYGTRDRLRQCLASLGDGAEVVVVDNNSPDGSADMVRAEFPHVTLIALPTNQGFSVGVNAAARAARGDLLLLLNPDSLVGHDDLARMPALLAALPGASAVGFRQVDERGDFQLTVGPPPSLALELVRRYVQRRLDAGDAGLGRRLDRLLSRPRRVPWVAGSVLLTTRAAFDAVGGFDESFFLYFEDIDFCLRLHAQVGPVWYHPGLTVTHVRGESARSNPGVARRAYRESQLRYWSKHRGWLVRTLVRAYQLVGRPG